MTNDDSSAPSSSCCSTVLRYENIICATGTAWGYLADKPGSWLAAWWAVRHIIYFGISIALLGFVPGSAFFVAPFFIVIHAYKSLSHACFSSSNSQKQLMKGVKKSPQNDPVKAADKAPENERAAIIDVEKGMVGQVTRLEVITGKACQMRDAGK
jgi:hypothetical protein